MRFNLKQKIYMYFVPGILLLAACGLLPGNGANEELASAQQTIEALESDQDLAQALAQERHEAIVFCRTAGH